MASNEVMVQLLKHKCLPILLYVLEVCNLDKTILQSLDFMRNRFFVKLFEKSNIEIVHYCETLFDCELPNVLLVKGMRNASRNLHVPLFSLLSLGVLVFLYCLLCFLATIKDEYKNYNKTVEQSKLEKYSRNQCSWSKV